MLCIYRVKPGKEEAFRELLKLHWPALERAGLVTAEPAKVFFGATKGGGTAYIEMFQWKDSTSFDAAHAAPDVLAVWHPMSELTEDMEFLEVERTHF